MPRLSGCDAGKPPMPSSVCDAGMLRLLRERPHDVHRPGQDDAVARENQRPLRGVDQLEGALIFLGTRAPVGTELRFPRGGRVPIELARRLLRVLRDVDVHGSGAARRGDLERLAERRRNVVGAGHQIVVLGDRQRDARHVRLLERIGADELAAHLAGDADDRRAVHHRCCDTRHHVGCAGPGCRDRDANPAARARIAVRHVRGALLVTDEHVADRIIEHRVISRKNGPAWITKNIGHPLANETFPNDLRSSAFHCCPHSLVRVGPHPHAHAVAYAPDLEVTLFCSVLHLRGAPPPRAVLLSAPGAPPPRACRRLRSGS